jgi:DNA primase
VAAGATLEDQLHEAVVLAVLLAHPALIEQFEGALERLECRRPEHARVQAALLAHANRAGTAGFRDDIAAAAGSDTLEKLHAPGHLRIVPALKPEADPDDAAMCIAEALAKLEARRGLEAEVAEAIQDLDALADEGLTWRLGQAAEARDRAQRSQTEDRTEYDLGPNGARIRREEKSAFAELVEKIDFGRPARRAGREEPGNG